jgi:glycosyltransferase involved in cell wall biosynthesis
MVLFVGRLDVQKDPQLFVDALQGVLERFSDVHLVLAGAGPLQQSLELEIAKLAERQRIHVIGQRSDIPVLMRSATCFVLPSRWEGMANAILEAMAAGCPIVATRVEGTTEILDHDRSGLLVPVGDPSAVAAAVTRLLTDTRLVAALTAAARQTVVETYSWERCVVQYEVLYRSLLAGEGPTESRDPSPV